MLIEDLFGRTNSETLFHQIYTNCSQFVHESAGYPLFRNLPTTYSDVHRVKVRTKKKASTVGDVFNKAFEHDYQNIAQRAIFAQSAPICESAEGMEPFYIFPVNGYKFLYSREITESTSEYQQVMLTLIEQLRDEQAATELITDLLKFSYTSHDLVEGINSGSEIILYGIPFYYAVRCSSYPDYGRIVSI